MEPLEPLVEVHSPNKRVRAEIAVKTVWIGSTVYPECPVWRVWYDKRLVVDTSTIGLHPETGGLLAYAMRLVRVTRHRAQTGVGLGCELRIRFISRDERELAVTIRVTDQSAYCAVRQLRKRKQMGHDISQIIFPAGATPFALNMPTHKPQVFFSPDGKVIAFWRHGLEQHLVFFDRPGDLAVRRFAALECVEQIVVANGQEGLDHLFLTAPFTKASLPKPSFSEAVTPAYCAAFQMMLGFGDPSDEVWMLRGEPRDFAVMARRQGAVWQVGGVTVGAQTLTVRFEELWLRLTDKFKALRYNVEILRDPLKSETGTFVSELFEEQAPDVRVVLDLVQGGGFLITFRPQGLREEVPEVQPALLSFVVPEGLVERMDVWLASQTTALSRARIQALIKAGRVTCAGVPIKAKVKTQAGQVIDLIIPAPVAAVPQPEDMPLDIVYEDSDILVINKSAGLVVHPAPGHAAGTLVNALLHHCHDLGGVGGVARPGIVHRLDKDTSGLMMVAKNDTAMAGCVQLFQTGSVTKEYLALVHGVPLSKSGILSSLIGRHPVHRQKMAVVKRNGKLAITHYVVEQYIGELTLIRCRIETGRTHQIRVHLQSLGCPVVGDALYGRPAVDKRLTPIPRRQMLHAARLAFPHPVTSVPLDFTATLPEDFMNLLQSLNSKTPLC